MILIKNIHVFTPDDLGIRDVLVCGSKIESIRENIEIDIPECKIIDGTDHYLMPGFIDKHVHITGGGGEGSFHTKTPEMNVNEMIEYGITTVVGTLGTDGISRTTENLLSKVKAINEEGMTAYMVTGSYMYGTPTITGTIYKDIAMILEVLGCKLAISDHRAPNVTLDEFIRLASDARVSGMLSQKPGYLELHVGDAKSGLKHIFDAVDQTAIPIKIFHPTHLNRNNQLIEESYKLLEMGGYADYTCGSGHHTPAAECIVEAIKRGIPTDKITISSDGHGSWSKYDDEGNLIEIGYTLMDCIYNEFKDMVQKYDMPIEKALSFGTRNAAKAIERYPLKGCIQNGSDADLLIMDKELALETVIARGKIRMENGKIISFI